MEYPYKSCISQIKYFRNMVNRLDVHTFIYFELASSSVVPVCEFVQKEVDRPTRLLQFLAFVHLPFSFRSLDLLVASLLFRKDTSSNEDMILALAGQFKQLSHEPEKFR